MKPLQILSHVNSNQLFLIPFVSNVTVRHNVFCNYRIQPVQPFISTDNPPNQKFEAS